MLSGLLCHGIWKDALSVKSEKLTSVLQSLVPFQLNAKAPSTIYKYRLEWQKWKKWELHNLGESHFPRSTFIHLASFEGSI